MKLVRFKKSYSAGVSYGCAVGSEVKSIEGDPFGDYKIGKTAGKLEDVKILSPCIPGKIIALAVNYKGATGLTTGMGEPVVFLKSPASITGPFDDIISPFKNVRVWGEAELGIVVGKRLGKVTDAEIKDSIFGYICANDVTAENVEGRDHHLVRSKGADTFCPVGPWIDTEFDPKEASVEGFQNGKLIRSGNLKDMVWNVEKIVAWLSQWMTLEKGDIILTGTPPRVAEKTYLNDGDIFEVKIEGLGSLKNRFISRGSV